MKELQKEVKELKKQVAELQSICNKLVSKLKDKPIRRRSANFNAFIELYYSDETYTRKKMAELVGVSTRMISRYKKELLTNNKLN